MMQKHKIWIITVLLAGILLAACAAAETATIAPSATTGAQPTETLAASPTITVTFTPEATLTPTATVTITPTATLVPLVYDRLPPERWREWPVVPTVTNRAREIYLKGIAMGRNPHSFTKVGDCQGIKEVLMGLFDNPVSYTLLPEEQQIQETIDWFKGSFNRDGYATMGGFTTLTILDNLQTDPEACVPGELALHCELRVHNPSIAIVSLEFWYPGRNPEVHEQEMRKIIEYLMDNGVVPILSTKADNAEGDHSINLVVAKLAYEYDLPLWNFWRAVQPMKNHGMDAERDDNFHISYAAWTVRSFSALRTLDSVWRGLRDLEP
jgi:hypothetical protein